MTPTIEDIKKQLNKNEINELIKQIRDKPELKTREEIELEAKKTQELKDKKKAASKSTEESEKGESDEADKDGEDKPATKPEGEDKKTDIQKLTEAMDLMAKEIQSLKKGGIARKKPKPATKTKEEDLPEPVTFKIQKNMFEVDV